MLAIAYVGLVAVLAYHLRTRVRLLDGFAGAFRYLFSLGLTLFLVNWLNFLLYVAFGWGRVYLLASWVALLAPTLYWSVGRGAGAASPAAPADPPLTARLTALLGSRWNWWFLFVLFFVLVRFYAGLDFDENSHLWSSFNFDDTAFHLSVTNALLNAHRFPPMDLDMAPYPLKYHFLVDFWLAHLQQLGVRPLHTVQAMNWLSATIMVGALWSAFRKWLRLPSRWILLACLVFLFLNTALINVVHYIWFKPPYLHPGELFDGLLLFPYFNFESSLINLFSPQRGLLFTFPVALLVLDAVFSGPGGAEDGRALAADRVRILQALVLVCLLPFSHIVTFPVLAAMLLPRLWEHRRWLWPRFSVWLPAFALGAFQLLYLGAYGPPTHPDYSAWDVASILPLDEFAAVPPVFRRALFWFFIDGDFLFWGCLFAATAFLRKPPAQPDPQAPQPLRAFLRRWGWYFAVCGLVFLGVNYYRYSFTWGDSNKFVLFLNLGLTMVIVLGAAELTGRLGRILSRSLWLLLLVLCVVPSLYRFRVSLAGAPHGSTLLFDDNDRAAARWLRTSTGLSDIVLTGANDPVHFVSSLGARPVLSGMYGDSNPYRQEERADEIRRVYEDGDLQALRHLAPRYVCVSRFERLRYQVNPCWREFRRRPGAVAFHAGDPDDPMAVYIFDANVLTGGAARLPAGSR